MQRYYKMLKELGKVKLVLIGLGLLLLLGWGVYSLVMALLPAPVVSKVDDRPPRIVIPKDFKIERRSTGGIGGSGDGKNITVTAAGILTIEKPKESKNLTFGNIEDLVKETNDATFFTLDASYTGEKTCPDAMSTAITVTMNGKTKQVSWSECPGAKALPAELTKINKQMLYLATTK